MTMAIMSLFFLCILVTVLVTNLVILNKLLMVITNVFFSRSFGDFEH